MRRAICVQRGMPKHRFLKTPDGESGLNYLCAGYKHFFHHIDPYMQFMAAELRAGRPPANIMRMVALPRKVVSCQLHSSG
jgi:sulfatase maturation enzyme AslB (radical SAM superfamily)